MNSGRFTDLFKHRSGSNVAQVYADTPRPAYKKGLITGFPARIDLPSVSISLPVQAGHYDATAQTWTLSNDSAYFATVTLPPNNEGGNTFIYAHDIPSAFKRLNDIKQGEKAVITTENKHRFVYEFVAQRDTDPGDTSLFDYRGEPVLTLQTCSGFFSQNRRLFVFKLIEAV